MRRGLEFGIALGHADQGIDVLRQILLGAEPHFRRGRLQRLGARLGDAQQYVVLVLGEAAHRLDERRDQVMAVLEMHVDVGERRVAALIERDQTIVCC